MTRINAGIPVQDLTNKHLIAEHREIKRIPNAVRSGKAKIVNLPKQFTLNTGHVRFFYDKLEYLRKRYEDLYKECLNRNFKITYYGSAWDGIRKEFMNDYTPTQRDREIVEQRIKERLQDKM